MTTSRRLRRVAAPEPSAKLAEVVAQQIEDDIVARGWPVGEVLGSEAELVAKYGVSRSALREAARLLEHHHVATMRPGPGGGLVVTEPESAAISRALGLYLEYRRVDVAQLLETLRALELTCVRLASERITAADVTRLRIAVEEERKTPEERRRDIGENNLHLLLAEMTGNPAMRVFVEILIKLAAAHAPDVTHAHETYEAHAEIAEAIIAGDVALATHAMSRHLDALAAVLK
jgi:DNA-binding FadR family transcriptional regulator